MIKTFLLILGSVIFLLVLIFVIFIMKITTPTVTIEKIYFPASDEYIFIKNKAKGLNYSVTVVSKSSEENFKPNNEVEYVYKAEPTLFYEMKIDTLVVYCAIKAEIPNVFKSNIVVIQQKISTIEFSELKENYLERGIRYFVPKYYSTE